MATSKDLKVADDGLENFDLSAEIIAGKLTSNAKELSEKIKAELKNYSVEKYIDNPDAAKKDKAFLTKVKTVVADKRKEVAAKWNEPLNVFLDEMKSLEVAVGDAYNELNSIVKKSEDSVKENKKKEIETYWNTLGNQVITLDRVFNQKWLNKTFAMKDIQTEINERLETINADLTTLKSMKDDSEILMAFYLETLDLNATLKKGNELKANKEKIKANEKPVQVEIIEKSFDGLCVKSPVNGQILTEIEQNHDKTEQKTPKIDEKPSNSAKEMCFVLRLFGTKEKLMALRKFIDANEIRYEKV